MAARSPPCHSQEETRLHLAELIGDPAITVRYRTDAGATLDHGSSVASPPPPPLREDVVDALTRVAATMWPGVPVVPEMETWATDSKHTVAAGIPSYGISGFVIDRDDVKGMHGRDERVSAAAFYGGLEFYYRFLKALTTRNAPAN